jgi:phosphoglycolate phosphatase
MFQHRRHRTDSCSAIGAKIPIPCSRPERTAVFGRSVLLLFDIDGTLLGGTRQAVGEAMLAALREVHGIDVGVIRTRIDTDGRTDGEIARAILVGAGVSSDRIDALADRVRESCSRFAARLLPEDLSSAVLPGVRDLLDWLTEQEGTKLGLLTGNYEPIARLKLARAGIGNAFPAGQGAFGSDAEDRAALPGIARRRTGTTRAPYPRCETIVIGDTPRDIACARADGVRCVAVATGSFTSEELAAADDVARDALQLPRILADLGVGLPRPAAQSESQSRQRAERP